MRILRKLLSLSLVLLLAFGPALSVRAETDPEVAADSSPLVSLTDAMELPKAPEIDADYAILIEPRSGTILYEKNAFAAAHPASTTKVMTALLAIENLHMDEVLTFSYRATHELEKGSSSIARTEGEQMTIRDCLYALMVASANEVAQALAEEVSGSFEAFAALMNLRAMELGCVNSHFSNPSGLTASDHYICAHDLALITREAVRNEKLRTIMGTTLYQIAPTNKHDEITYMKCHHPLLTGDYGIKYSYAVAGKTGSTTAAQSTLTTYAVKGDMELICVVMHSKDTKTSGTDTLALFEYGFSNFTSINVLSAELTGGSSSFLSGDILSLTSSDTGYLTLPRGFDMSELSTSVIFNNSDSDDTVAIRYYTYRDKVVGKIPLTVELSASPLPIEPVVSVAPSSREVLRTVYLGLPLVIWILIGGGLLLLLFLILLAAAAIRHLKRREQRRRRREKLQNNR